MEHLIRVHAVLPRHRRHRRPRPRLCPVSPAPPAGDSGPTATNAKPLATRAQRTGPHGRVGVRYLASQDGGDTAAEYSQPSLDLRLDGPNLGGSPVGLNLDARARRTYQTFADGGFRTPLRAIRAIVTADGKPLQRYPLNVEPVAPPAPVYLLTTALQGVVREGTAQSLINWLPAEMNVAGKTGTTQNNADGWFMLMHPQLVTGAWVGFNDPRVTLRSSATVTKRVSR